MVTIYFFLLGLPALCMAWIHESGYECPETWFFDLPSKSCVKPFHDQKPWKKARKACEKEGSDLIAIKSRQTTNTVRVILRKGKKYWIGVDDKNNDGKYFYVDGSAVGKYKPWGSKEPSNHGGNEKCVEMRANKKGSWNDKKCGTKRFFVCQQPAKFMLECPVDWKMYKEDKLCILPYTERMSWTDARITCKGVGGDLLKLRNKQIAHFIKEDVARRTRYWIGARDWNKNGEFEFMDGDKVGDFVRWARLEPNNLRGNEHCLEIIGNKRLSWNDKRCGRKRNFVCERPADMVGGVPGGEESPPVVVNFKK